MADFIAWHGRTLNDHVALRDDFAKKGYRYLSISVYGSKSSPVYAAVMIRRPQVVAQRDWPALDKNGFQQVFNEQAKQGFGPVMIAATGSSSDPLFTAVFQPMNPIPLTRHLLRHGDDENDLETFAGMNRKARKDGLILLWAAIYGDEGDPRYAAIWVPNSSQTLWNADGRNETGDEYQARFNAQTAAWTRPSFVTLSRASRYVSLFVDNEVGPWVARHGMTPDGYQSEFNTWTQKGFFPVCVQAGGKDAASARFAALFVQSESLIPRQWHATGTGGKAQIDDVVHGILQKTPAVRHAALAIVHGRRLVYARGYTWSEPEWPLAQPTTRFRTASVSKAITALAIQQLIEEKNLKLGDKLQSILQLKRPGGQAPKDSRFGDITVQHLLEHTSGLNANAFRDAVAVRDAHRAAQPGQTWNLPVNAAMMDSYVAGLDLVSDPGAKQQYNNCGYYMLGRIVARKRGASDAMKAFQAHLLDPLGAKRFRASKDLVSAQPADEARYQSPELTLTRSVLTEDRPWVPIQYGNEQLELHAGSGGISAAVTDQARIAAILMMNADNPALKRASIEDMLTRGAGLSAAGKERAGYGFDFVSNLGNHSFYGQKGGSLATSGNVLEFNGDWGLIMCWAGTGVADATWYPDFPAVMNVARNIDWGSTDLFPLYGMPSL